MDAHERCEDVLQDPEDGEVCSFSCESGVADMHLIVMPQYQVPIYLTYICVTSALMGLQKMHDTLHLYLHERRVVIKTFIISNNVLEIRKNIFVRIDAALDK